MLPKYNNDRHVFQNENNNEQDKNDAEELDGWRGYYSPFLDGMAIKKPIASSSAASRTMPPRPPTNNKRSASSEQRILEEHLSTATGIDDSRGSLFASSPFEMNKVRIVALASCTSRQTLYVASITDAPNTTGVIVHTNPHMRLLTTLPPPQQLSTTMGSGCGVNDYSTYYKPLSEYNFKYGNPRCVSLQPGVCCVGTDSGVVLIYVFDCHDANIHGVGTSTSNTPGKMAMVAEIPAPRGGGTEGGSSSLYCVSNVQLVRPDEVNDASFQQQQSYHNEVYRLFVSYRRRNIDSLENHPEISTTTPTGGVCCYDLGGLRIPGSKMSNISSSTTNNAPVVSARYDMDGRDVPTSCLCDGVSLPPSVFDGSSATKGMPRYSVARGDGLHLYSCSEKVGVCPVDGNKIGMCTLPHAPIAYLKRRRPRPAAVVGNEDEENVTRNDTATAGASYVLVATTDAKSNRDAVDIYDTSNKLVGFHVLLSPGHRALRTGGVMSAPVVSNGVLMSGGRASGVVFTSGGSIVTLTGECGIVRVAKQKMLDAYRAQR
jgi:hypothetical protein